MGDSEDDGLVERAVWRLGNSPWQGEPYLELPTRGDSGTMGLRVWGWQRRDDAGPGVMLKE